jgi:hypothetical protein
VFDGILSDDDARRATGVIDEMRALGFRGTLTGGLAIAAHLTARGQSSPPRSLNDIDFVVDCFDSIPESLADVFLLHHVHPFAREGKTLMQVIDPNRAVRVDVFRAVGATLSRSAPLNVETGRLGVVAAVDLLARVTAHVYGSLHRERAIDTKYVRAFLDLSTFDSEPELEAAWLDHRADIAASFEDASRDTRRLLALRRELVITETYSAAITPCAQCQDYGRFRCAAPERVVEALGYW